MDKGTRTGIFFGATSGVITTIGLMVGLQAGTQSVTAVFGGVVVIAVSDSMSDALGKAIGVNGGYVVPEERTISFLRETTPSYIYSNPITPAEAAAAIASLRILVGAEGRQRLANLSQRSEQLRTGLTESGYETIAGEHPIIPIMIRDTDKTSALVAHLFENNILVTGLNYPVVPKGDEEIRLQVSASHTEADVSYLLEALQRFH